MLNGVLGSATQAIPCDGWIYDSFLLSPKVKDFWVIMQSTGLTDKNGKEIFEGDVLQWKQKGVLRGGYVEWHEYKFHVLGFYDPKQDIPEDAFSENYPLEVIGNIYENQDLLPRNEQFKRTGTWIMPTSGYTDADGNPIKP